MLVLVLVLVLVPVLRVLVIVEFIRALCIKTERARAHPIEGACAAALRRLLFGDEKGMFSSAWREQGLVFSREPGLAYGLVQVERVDWVGLGLGSWVG